MLHLGRAPKRGTGCFFFFGKIAGCAKQILEKDLGHIIKIQALECLEGVLIGTRVL